MELHADKKLIRQEISEPHRRVLKMNYEDLQNIEGIQVVPVDETKRPIVKKWQTSLDKHSFKNAKGVGVVCGTPSGNLECLDIDLKYDITGKLFDSFKKIVHRIDPNLLSKLVLQKTRSGGYHLIYRCSVNSGNIKLANRPTTEEERNETYKESYLKFLQEKKCDDKTAKEIAEKEKANDKVRVLFETRGIGGQFVCHPTPGYEFIFGDLYSISEITPDEREILFNTAMQFNEIVEEVIIPKQKNVIKTDGLSPFDDYNQRGDVCDLLMNHGWKFVNQKGSKTHFLRPGQSTAQTSGNFDSSKNWFSVFTTSSEFEPNKAYLPYAVFAKLECNNDFSEASRKLFELGYGAKQEKVLLKDENKKPSTRVIQSRINPETNEDSFFATPSDYDDYLQLVRDGKLQMGLSTGSPELDRHFLFKEGNLVMINGIDNVGKALSLDTLIPTTDGWKCMGEITVGDFLFDEKGNPCEVIAETEIQNNQKCYEIAFSNGEKIKCSGNHLWGIKTINKFYRVLSTKEMFENGAYTQFKNKKLFNYTVDMPSPIKMPKRGNWIINPYSLGVWLGDGNARFNRIYGSEKDIYETAKNLNDDGTVAKVVKQKNDKYEIQLKGKNSTSWGTLLKCLGLYNNKHIPIEYLRGSVEERICLLQGLMDTDGYVSEEGRLEFCNQNEKIIEGFKELLSSLGLKYSLHSKTPSINGIKMSKNAFYVSFSCSKEQFYPFKMERKRNKISDSRKRGRSVQVVNISEIISTQVKCIQVSSPSRLFLCGKTMLPTHNSEIVWWMGLIAAMYHGWKGIIFSSENTLGAFMRRTIQLFWGKPLRGDYAMNDYEFQVAKKFIEEHFLLIKAQEDLYNYKDIINLVKIALGKGDYKYGMIDPYNSLKIDLSGFSKLSTHEYHYEALSEIKSFGQQNNFGWFVNNHAVTSALRMKDADRKYPVAPRKEDTEGGGKFSNKADDFMTVHRVTQHPTEWMITELHVRKIKDTETGGKPTSMDMPVKFERYKGGYAYCEWLEGGTRGIDPIQEWHWIREGRPTQKVFSPTTRFLPYKDDAGTEIGF